MYDVLIVGSGVVGLAQALLLAQEKNLHLALIDAKNSKASWSETTHDARVYAITPHSKKILEKAGVWDSIQSKRLSLFKRMWIGDGLSEMMFDHAQLGVPALGYIIEENLLRSVLLEKLSSLSQVDLFFSAEPVALQENEEGIQLSFASKNPLRTRLLIAADGAHSWVRAQAGITMREHDYQHSALIAQIETEEPHQETARQFFLSNSAFPKGPLAFLPLQNSHHCSIVWSTSPQAAESLFKMDETALQRLLTQASDSRLGNIRAVSERHLFPLSERRVEHYIKNRLALIGDAAHTLHPLAGQGVNLGLADAALLAEVIFGAIDKNRDYACFTNLRRYERARKSENSLMQGAVKLIKAVFETENKGLSFLRNQGLKIVNQSVLLKTFIAHQAGLSLE